MSLQIDVLITLFVVIDPLGLVPMFVVLTHGKSNKEKLRLAAKSTFIAFVILLIFILSGGVILKSLGISISALQISGGILLFLISIDMIFVRNSAIRSTTEQENHEAEVRDDISVFPLAIPLIAGPGAITTLLLVKSKFETELSYILNLSSLVLLVLVMAFVFFVIGNRLMAWFGETGSNVITRVLGILLAGLAVQYVIDGFKASMQGVI